MVCADEIAAFWSNFVERAPGQASALVAAGEFEQALNLASMMTRENGYSDDADRQRAGILDALRERIASLHGEDQAQEAPQFLDVLLRELPNDAFALSTAATAAMDSADFARALGYWERLASVEPENDQARRGTMRCRLLLGDTDADQERAVSAA